MRKTCVLREYPIISRPTRSCIPSQFLHLQVLNILKTKRLQCQVSEKISKHFFCIWTLNGKKYYNQCIFKEWTKPKKRKSKLTLYKVEEHQQWQLFNSGVFIKRQLFQMSINHKLQWNFAKTSCQNIQLVCVCVFVCKKHNYIITHQ